MGLKDDLQSKSRDKFSLPNVPQEDAMTMMFQRLPGGIMKLCLQHGGAKPSVKDSGKEEGLKTTTHITGLDGAQHDHDPE